MWLIIQPLWHSTLFFWKTYGDAQNLAWGNDYMLRFNQNPLKSYQDTSTMTKTLNLKVSEGNSGKQETFSPQMYIL